MQKQSNKTDKYKLSNGAVVTVKNTKKTLDDGKSFYGVDFTLKHSSTSQEALSFNDIDAIEDFIGKIELEDPQTKLNV